MSIPIIGGNGKDFNQINVANVRRLAPSVVDDEEYLREQFGKPRAELSPEAQQQWDRELLTLRRGQERIQAVMSPKDALGLPPLLEARRLEWHIPDGAFMLAPLYDRVFVYQIETYLDGKKGQITMSERKQSAEKRTNPRGILVAAGALALDSVRSNGCDLGHVVRFQNVNPLRLVVDYSDGQEFEVQLMTAGDLTGSEDLSDMLRSGAVRMEKGEDGKHRYVNQEGATFDPTMPWVPQGM